MELVKKITAPNPGVFTGGGTNTYLVGREDLTLIDPGPNIKEHIDEIIRVGENKIKRILVTHTHTDHSPAALPISKVLDVPMYGRLIDGESSWEDETFIPDVILNDADIIKTDEYTLEVIHTPGHASNHLCFLIKELNCLITGDHIMDGSTVVIGPPDGNMADYLESLNKLFKYKIDCLAPGHGNFMYEPKKVIESIIRHRLSREAKVLRRLEDVGDIDLESLTAIVYDDVPEQLHPIAKFSLEAHLLKLLNEGVIKKDNNNFAKI
ncbi:MBL fold metallo-hydrolase [Gammaproteobacteria bacterium]|jgi:glyoxylase-like metal-dependent hydrolase (beta-lactamase superfamily II)|nr:MBL fold metallo-hydrolase [Gammaproteobacteria bacterium]MDB2489189.1 MBL fold metallo-hydrolase [Gammaproteobacteria bacterium]MDC0923574.1 MBL fold metallo-hydrolase [Gammaproteobacteria bacterium]MDC3368347.1 MBL fold metallo-hydrolase [Gammaproteobacteria bacterium]